MYSASAATSTRISTIPRPNIASRWRIKRAPKFRRFISLASSTVSDAWVDPQIAEIDQQIEGDEQHGEKQRRAHHQRIIAVDDGRHESTAKSRNPEDRF